jgi:hypothetical protein
MKEQALKDRIKYMAGLEHNIFLTNIVVQN